MLYLYYNAIRKGWCLVMETNVINEQSDSVVLSSEAVSEFLSFLENREEYLDTGLGAFHTDDHNNW